MTLREQVKALFRQSSDDLIMASIQRQLEDIAKPFDESDFGQLAAAFWAERAQHWAEFYASGKSVEMTRLHDGAVPSGEETTPPDYGW